MRACLSVLFLLTLCHAQECQPQKLLVSISDKELHPVIGGISAVNLKGSFEGKPVQIESLRRIEQSARVLVLMDVSGSMNPTNQHLPGTSPNLALRPTVEAIFQYLPSSASVASGTFAKHMVEMTRFSSDHAPSEDLLLSTLDGPKSFDGLTAIADSMLEAIQRFGPVQPGDSVILITDGGDNKSKNLHKALAHFQQAGIRLFLFLLLGNDRNVPEELEGPHVMSDAVEETGGTMCSILKTLNIKDPNNQLALLAVTQRILARLDHAWELAVRLPAIEKPRGKFKLELTGLNNSVRKKFLVEYPRHLSACPGEPASVTAASK
jgi:hypothetical protein